MPEKKELSEEELNIRHAEKMHKKKEARKKILATKTIEKGLIIVHTGKGKGKTTAAFGMIFRALGNNLNVAVVQFVKGQWLSGERAALDKFRDKVKIHKMGEGFTWETQDRARDIEAAKKAWEKSKELIADTNNKVILLDELNIVLRYNYLPIEQVINTLHNKPKDTHIIITGRNAKDEIIEIADLVTSMELIKHPFRSGVKAQVGIEF
ncbi:MAG: cob(I)yrinic acid a,c-diamide adenosyltransferase [Alphaproteobacteria bacterium]|uniref:Corrinoid adenosyltransferase n=1 Tax=PS1 clade bacterium TaxID=2175152 RepID=A0A368DN80_9PROT|nr:cob(I)yrinic acid a,c-diamide adenosyltransferase [Rhodobiaceae bacterium]OUT73830.1 MAG: cob(I)yrinic acid a,c-diamide adenosyltransferase [Rhizobiales bacterium TMED25]RCL73292.1 MAG: cob(I)yrinic acid a,c-diamide adenosyltransferase [PS1 clade bacterium]|tara:strand:- start:749 stop:1375 length:627 start_codon:yes stop_codon:yes gene_type:complete